MGSSRAEIQDWTVHMDRMVAESVVVGRRQLRRMARKLDVKPLVMEVASLVAQGKEDPRLKWIDGVTVQIRIGKILPDDSANARTLLGRRRRFAEGLRAKLMEMKWELVLKTAPHTYRSSRPPEAR